jgi:hypothetical protein
VGGRGTEESEQPVSGQLRDCATEAAYLVAHETHDLVEEELGPLWAEFLGDCRRAANIRDEDGHDPPVAGGHDHTARYSAGDLRRKALLALESLRPRRISRAAFKPGVPITPPPGCAAAPHR